MSGFLDYLADNGSQLLARTGEHCLLVLGAVGFALVAGIPLGILLARHVAPASRTLLFYIIGLGQTIPSLAILAIAVRWLGVGWMPALAALALYALLPVVRNTYTGIRSVPEPVSDAARGMGMSRWQIVRSIELPLAAPLIAAGLRTTTVLAISAASLAYLIGGGGLGDFIFTGIALFKPQVMLAGAVPTALLALAADWGLGRLERRLQRR
jgi:osmoprotectant transport system permease protein